MSRSMFSRRGAWILFVLFGLIPYCIGADGFCTPVTSSTPTDTGTNTGTNTDTGQTVPTVNGSPHIVFSSPASSSTYSVGDSVVVTLTANDPENDFDWSLYYDRDGVFNGNEVAIQSGSRKGSSLVQAIWPTAGLSAGTYTLWALVTDSGGNTDRTSVGQITLTSSSTTGSIQVSSPASSVAVTTGGTVSVLFSATNAPTGSTINVFYDTDDDFSNGVTGTIALSLASNTTSAVWDTTGVASGVYYIGASLGTGTSGRVAAYAPGQVTVGSSNTNTTTEGLTGLTLAVTEPSGPVTISKGGMLTIQFTAKDTTGGTNATVDLYYVALNADGSTPAYTGNETKIKTGLSVSSTSYSWTVNLDAGVYRVGGTIGRSSTPRLVSMAAGKVQVTTSGGGGGGGGGSTTPSFTVTTPSDTVTPAPITRAGEYQVKWTATLPQTIQFFYALDDDKDRVVDTGAAWTAFTAVVSTTAESGSVKFTPSSIPLTRGTYLIKGILTPSDGSAAIPVIAPGWIGIEEMAITAPLVPVQIDKAVATSKMSFAFKMTNPTPSPMVHTFGLSTRNSPASSTYQPVTVSPVYPTTGLTTDPIARDLLGSQLLTGLNFLKLEHQVTVTNGTAGAYTDPAYATVPVYVYDSTSQSPLTNPITVLKPSTYCKVVEGTSVEVDWFLKDLPTITGDGSVTLFYERLTSTYQPSGDRTDFPNNIGLAPLRCYGVISTSDVKYTLEDLLIGARYSRTGQADVIAYAPGLLRVQSASERTMQVTAPGQNLVAYVGAPVTVAWTATDPSNRSNVRVFWDHNGTFDGDEVEIARGLAMTDGSYTFSTGTAIGGQPMVPGLYFLGASLGPNDDNRTSAYAIGRLLVVKQGETVPTPLSVRAPAGGGGSHYTTAIQGNPIKVIWFVNDSGQGAANLGSCRVFSEPDANEDDTPDGSVTRYFPPNTLSPYESIFLFNTAVLQVGKSYFFGVQYTDGTGKVTTAYAPAKVRIVANSIWMGNVGQQYVPGTTFEGVNYYDLAGSSLSPMKDIDGDGYDDFVIVSQFGKPGWDNGQFGINGASVGEAYVIYGGPQLANKARWSLNATGTNVIDPTNGLPGFVLTGLASDDANPGAPVSGDRGGISGVLAIPDQDDDGAPELLFAFPEVSSSAGGILTKAGHFLRGGYVEVSSRNPFFHYRAATDGVGGRAYGLSNVGQRFSDTVHRTLPGKEDLYGCLDVTDSEGKVTECAACCLKGSSSDCHDEKKGQWACPSLLDTVDDTGYGFTHDLANSDAFLGGWSPDWMFPQCKDCGGKYYWVRGPSCDAVHFLSGVPFELSTGFYLGGSVAPYGLRMLGQSVGEQFASSMSWVDDMLLIGAPGSSSANGKGYRFQLVRPGLNSLSKRYGDERSDLTGPRPYQYIADPSVAYGNCNGAGAGPLTTFYNTAPGLTPGRANEQLGVSVSGIADFNGDGLGDYVLGSPGASIGGNASCGAVYLIYRRVPALDTDRDLRDIELGQTTPDRKIGAMIHGRSGEHFGEVVGTGADVNGDKFTEKLDLNHDGLPDLVMGNYQYDGHRGEIVVLFGNTNLESPANGYGIDDLLTHTGSDSKPDLGCVIRGEQQGDDAGFNISYAGDFDGDGTSDLLIAAPNASAQVDTNGDGVAESVLNAGKVYLILGSNKFVPGGRYSLAMVGQPDVANAVPADAYDFTKKGIKGLVFSGHHAGDQLGGGQLAPYDSSDPTNGGIGTTGMRAHSISWAGDINGDGLSDILIGAPMAGLTSTSNTVQFAGEVYLVFGFPLTN